MKKLFFVAVAIVCLMASCTKDNTEMPSINPNAGKEVIFSSSVGAATRTLYADEYTNGIAVKWVTGDVVSVYGTTCDVKQADYSVTAAANPIVVNNQNFYYAESLNKTGAAGVQWGSEGTSDFYAVYPATSEKFTPVVDENDNVTGVIVQSTVSEVQNITMSKTTDSDGNVTWIGQHYTPGKVDDNNNPIASMADAVMYAVKTNAEATNADGSTKEVDLNFKPFSTVLRFTFEGFEAITSAGELDVSYNTSPVTVSKITLTAPNAKIAGDFTMALGKTTNSEGNEVIVAEAGEGTTNVITIYPDYLPLTNGQKLQFDVFTVPTDVTLSATETWVVQVETQKGSFNYNIVPQKINADGTTEAVDAKLAVGKIHKVPVGVKRVTFDFDLLASEWMKYIPRNVYLSELTLPGAWYATNSDYQGTATLADMYAAGVRAFNIDCRVTAKAGNYLKGHEFNLTEDGGYLAAAGSESTTEWVIGVTLSDGLHVEDAMSQIAEQVKDDEFIMVILTIAEKYKRQGTATYAHMGTVNPEVVLSEIKTMLDANGAKWNVYGYREGDKPINSNTTINDVLGSILVKINVNVDQDKISLADYGMSNVLLCEGSMASDSEFIDGNIAQGTFNMMLQAPLYWGATQTDPTMTYFYHQAQETTSDATTTSGSATPSLYDRMLAINDLIDEAYLDYVKNEHNGLYQLGIGGYIGSSGSEDRATVALTLNQHLLNTWVNPKLNGDTKDINGVEVTLKPSPLGIILMNHCVTSGYYGPELVQALVEMNTKFYLNRNTEAEEWPNGNPFDATGDDNNTDNNGGGTEEPEV